MHESPADVDALQALLDRSYASAGIHLQSIHQPGWRLNAAQVCELLQGVCVLDLATVSAAHRPFVAPVDGLFFQGRFWFSSSHQSQRFRHIRNNPNVSAAYTVGEQISMLVHGQAIEIDTASGAFEDLREYCLEIYGSGYDDWGFWGKQPYAYIDAERMFAIRIDHNTQSDDAD